MHRDDKIIITSELVELIKAMAMNFAASIGADPAEYYQQYYLNLAPHAEIISTIGRNFGFKKGDRILEIGSGLGTKCLIGTAMFGADFTGLEPCANSYFDLKRAIVTFQDANPHLPYRSVSTSGESTGFAENYFDYVLSFEVLEHVQNPAQVIDEMHRVLRPGGKIFISSCNYASFYEGHFRCFWFPFLSSKLQRKYLRLIGRNDNFLNEINLITKRKIRRFLNEAGFGKIRFQGCYHFRSGDELCIEYPADYIKTNGVSRAKLIQRLVQAGLVQNLLSTFDREYKLYLIAEKLNPPLMAGGTV